LGLSSNERLEFLGDAVLGMVFADELYQQFPFSDEGELTQLRSNLVRRSTLAGIAGTIGIGDYLYLGKGEEASGGREKPANLSAVMEAVVAAIYLDLGWDAVKNFILRVFETDIKRLIGQKNRVDYKTQLQHLIQSRQQETPVYRVIDVTGPDNERVFTVEVTVGDATLATGTGKSKKIATTKAALVALENLKENFTL
jgi:ribonuclease-3